MPTIVEEMSEALAIMYERMELEENGETQVPLGGFSPDTQKQMIHLAMKAASKPERGYIVFLSPQVVSPKL